MLERARHGFRVCLSRFPTEEELKPLVELYTTMHERFTSDKQKARDAAGQPPGETPQGCDVAELAAWTVVGNVLLNLDEMLMKR